MFKKAGSVRYAFTAPFLDYTYSMKDEQFYLYFSVVSIRICTCNVY